MLARWNSNQDDPEMKDSPLKVYGFNYCGRERRIVAARSWAEVGKLNGVRPREASAFGHVTHNKEDIELAMKKPGTIWRKSYKQNSEWEQVNQQ